MLFNKLTYMLNNENYLYNNYGYKKYIILFIIKKINL